MSDKLVKMANEIAKFFGPYSDEEGVAGIRHHITAFWTPKMRATLVEQRASGQAADLHPLVEAALRAPSTEASPTRRESAGPATAGEVGASDAG